MCTREYHDSLVASADWPAYRLVGYQASGENTALELRNCPECKTTLARELIPAGCWRDFASHVAACAHCVSEYETANVRSDDIVKALCETGQRLARTYWASRGWED